MGVYISRKKNVEIMSYCDHSNRPITVYYHYATFYADVIADVKCS